MTNAEFNDSEAFKRAGADRVGNAVLFAWKKAEAHLKEIGAALDLNIADLLLTWVYKLRHGDLPFTERVVVCEIEVHGDSAIEAGQDACDIMHDALVNGTGLYFNVYNGEGASTAKIAPRTTNTTGRLLADKGLTVIGNGDVYPGLPEIHVADYDGQVEHEHETTHATLNLKTLLESLSDEQLRAHVEWRTPDADFGRTVVNAGTDRGGNARQRPRMPPR